MKNYQSPWIFDADELSRATNAVLRSHRLVAVLDPDAYAAECAKIDATPETVEHEQWARIVQKMITRLTLDRIQPGQTTVLNMSQPALCGAGHSVTSKKPVFVGKQGTLYEVSVATKREQ